LLYEWNATNSICMNVYTISFQFRNSTRIANVYFTTVTNGYTIYFTDVELILEFGCKASYSQKGGFSFLKTGKDLEALKIILSRQIEALELSV
jgi:hypothetical protein